MAKDEAPLPAPNIGQTYEIDGSQWVVTRYEPGVFTVFHNGKVVDAVEVQEIVPPPPRPKTTVMAAPELEQRATPPKEPKAKETKQ